MRSETPRFPARRFEVAGEPGKALATVIEELKHGGYRFRALDASGSIQEGRHGSLGAEFVGNVFDIPRLFNPASVPGRVIVTAEPGAHPGITTVLVAVIRRGDKALADSVLQRVEQALARLAAAGVLLTAGAVFSAEDLPRGRPGNPRWRR